MPRQIPPPATDWSRIEVRNADDTEQPKSADVYIYDEIGSDWYGEGTSAKAFAQQVEQLDVDTIRLYLNSPGGDVFDGLAIMNALRRHKARVEVTVDGLAASIASVIAMAGDHVTMNRGSQMMIHNAWGVSVGNAADMTQMAGYLNQMSDSIADTYAARAGGNRETWRSAMDAETWYTAEEAVAAGLADEWVDKPASSAKFDLSRFQFKGRAQAPAPRLVPPEPPAINPPTPAQPGTDRKDATMSDTLAAGLRDRLGVSDAGVSEERLLAALDEKLQAPAPTVPPGAALIDEAALNELRADAAAGRQARAEQVKANRDAIIAAALADGRIAPASQATWREQLDKNEEGTVALINSLVPNTIPVEEIGHAKVQTDDQRLMAQAGWDDPEGVQS